MSHRFISVAAGAASDLCVLGRDKRRRFLGDQVKYSKASLVVSVICGLALLESLLWCSCRPRRLRTDPGLPLQYAQDTWAVYSQRERVFFAAKRGLVGYRTPERLNTPRCAGNSANHVETARILAEVLFLTHVGVAKYPQSFRSPPVLFISAQSF